MSIREFSKKYKNRMGQAEKTSVRVFQLDASNSDIETNLCIAAATSKETLANLIKETGYKRMDSVSCNGMPIKKFGKKYSS